MAKIRAKRSIESWEVALIKAMLMQGNYNRDQILSYFSRPDRTINPARINEIAKNEKYADVEVASAAQVAAFLKTFQSQGEARHRFFTENPLHPVNLSAWFRLKDGSSDILHVDETDFVEFKESLNFANKAAYARVIVSFANARGGFLIFGARDTDKLVKGIPAGRLSGYDSAKLNQYLSDRFLPVPLWEKTEMEIGGKTIGVIYVHAAAHKPIICARDDGADLKEADIYYRYPGETRRIKYGELVQILSDRLRQVEAQWASMLDQARRAGIENIALLNTATGEVAGPSGRFLIDESLIPKLKFVTEGHFSETEGQPTLRLVGQVQAAGAVVTKVHLTDSDLMADFVNRNKVADPSMYVRHLAHSAKLWLPAFYYIRQARMSEQEAVQLIKSETAAKQKHVQDLIRRITKRVLPTGAPSASSAEPERGKILDKSLANPSDADGAKALLKAVRTLKPGDIHPEFLFPLLKHTFESFRDQKTSSAIQYALAHVDVVWHVQILEAMWAFRKKGKA